MGAAEAAKGWAYTLAKYTAGARPSITSGHKGERESTLVTENARLKRQLAEQAEELGNPKKAATYFAKHQNKAF